MVVNTVSKYQEICSYVCGLRCSDGELERIKTKFAEIIRSKRRLEQVTCLSELLHILEKRDNLKADNIESIIEIAAELRDERLRRLINSYNNFGHNYNNSNNCNNTNDPLDNIYNCGSQGLPHNSRDVKTRVYDCIAKDIGQKWSAFARALTVREGHIDHLNDNRNFTSRVYAVLRYHEENCDPRFWQSELLDALTDARRNDLRKRVQHIFDTSNGN